MKAKIISQSGEKGSVEMPEFFSMRIREDITQKLFEAQKRQQPYAPFFMAGKTHSASGNLSHSRRLWKTSYGKGISRVPRKIMWRRGDHFYWIGAEISSTVGGRPAHPPRVEHFQKKLKINEKEAVIALQSVMAATGNIEFLRKRYSSMQNAKIELPLIISSDVLKLNTKQFFAFLENILGEFFNVALKHKKQRAGKGKARNRRYKQNAGLLLVIGKDEEKKIGGIDVRRLDEIEISDLYPLGRLTVYTEQAAKELNLVGKDTEKKK